MNAGVLMNEWARSQRFDDQDMLTRINCAVKWMMQYPTRTLFTFVKGSNRPPSQKWMNIIPFPQLITGRNIGQDGGCACAFRPLWR